MHYLTKAFENGRWRQAGRFSSLREAMKSATIQRNRTGNHHRTYRGRHIVASTEPNPPGLLRPGDPNYPTTN